MLWGWASSAGAQVGNPFEGDAAAIRTGRTLYAGRCAACHGADARGGQGPNLTVLWIAGKSDAQVFDAVRQGVANTVMPPSTAPDDELWAIVAYLRSIGTVPPFTSERGDSARGREIFRAECASCHRAEGGGGAVGTDLSRIALIRSREALIRAIREPSAAIEPDYRAVTLVERNGERIEGIAKGEDAFSIQIIDTESRLQGYLKADLAEVVYRSESLMPAYGTPSLSARELDHLLAFLGTLREGAGLVAASTRSAAAARSEADAGARPDVVTDADLRAGLEDASRWLSYSGDYSGQRHSPLREITPENVHRLEPIWVFQSGTLARGRGFETTPLVLDGVLYVTGSNNFAWALDARTGRRFWEYRRELPSELTYGATAPVNRGFGILGDLLFMVTLDAHLVALDRRTGTVVWDVELADYRLGYAATLAPLVVAGKVIVGISGGEYATRGFIDAYDPNDGTRLWRFHTIPGPGEPGSETWPSTEVMARGGGATWMTGSYDPELDLLYWGTGNPNPDYYGADRIGDNLFTASLVAVEAQTGKLRWHYQFTPHDTHDWDSNHVPVLAELTIGGKQRRVVMAANRNGFFYVLDRATGELLLARPFTDTTWARAIGSDGRPIVLNPDGSLGCLPDYWGGTNFMPPSFDPALGLFFVTARETCSTYHSEPPELVTGETVLGGVVWVDRDFRAYGALRALDATTGERRWEFRYATPTLAGVMSTATGLVFGGDNEGNFMAFDSRTGENLWSYSTGASIWGTAAMTHMLDGRQHVLIPSGGALIAFALDAPPNPYTTLPQWARDLESAPLGSVSAVYPSADGRVWVAERCGGNDCVGHDEVAPIRLYDDSGRLVRAVGAGLFAWPHGLYVDADGNVWVTDARAGEGKGHQVVKMSATGEVLMRLGAAGVPGGDAAHFNGPTAVVVAPSGDIFVADGHELDSNNRIVKLARDGTFIKAWGGSGSAPGQFLVPHALALDSRGRLFVADRDNNRIQIFDQDGEFLEAWAQFGRPSGIFIDANDTLYVSDNQSNTERNPGWPRGIRVGSARDGTVTAFIPDPDFDPANAQETSAHGIAADAAGNIYGAEVGSETVKKYVRR